MLPSDYKGQTCTIARALEQLGERWTLLVLRDAFFGVRRYSDFLMHLRIPRAVLSARLQTLCEYEVLAKRRYSEQPERFEYVLTDKGLALWPVLFTLTLWGAEQLPANGVLRVYEHADCGGSLDATMRCARCGQLVALTDIVTMVRGHYEQQDEVTKALRGPLRLLTPLRGETPVSAP